MSKILQRFFGFGYRYLKMIRLSGPYYGGLVYHVGPVYACVVCILGCGIEGEG